MKGLHFDVDVVAGDDRLSSNRAYLNLDVHNTERLGADVDLDQAGVDGLVELTEASDEADGAWQAKRFIASIKDEMRETHPG